MSIHQAQMPLCQRDFSQLLIIDAQERLAAAMPRDELEGVTANIQRLISAAKTLDIPVIATQHNSRGLGPIIAPIREALPEAAEPTEKTAFSCCTAPGFERNISASPERRQLVVVGMEAHICIVQTVSGLQRWGYQVFVPADGIISRHPAYKQNVLERMRHCGIQVVCTESVGFEWLGDSSDEQFRAVWSLFKE
ncbi:MULTISPECIES: isochorismatase family protein [Marichromatium]|uniref:Nicotinamidase-related amidase n=1 Tax=Marichromatium gracile TaxID=1048 RepID=A0A4R4AKK2_MARGR|nr:MULTISPECIES: isochorismatase family protein [Marichromatium]MBO8087118.1 isochorismatase family protein [Marichromatium sp.]MBK1707590.1 isochorismatase [Marichromatium gracile]RNE90903.1 isochorismatase family protein [Marichromatium sp. AB32]RNE91934.1 isochorismatase family protein [Marichromatium sp. AB31]TCW39941.1 nicotinamidase-related amidase [Marichromatium gracile]